MFFYPSKLFWFLAAPTNALTLLVALGAVLMFTRFVRTGRLLAVLSALGLLAAGASPLPFWLMRPLEDRFPIAVAGPDVTGVIVLGGAIGTSRGGLSVNDAGARMIESAALALRFPGMRVAFTGGDGSLLKEEDANEAPTEADAAGRFYRAMGVAPERITLEDRSRNTWENAIFVKPLVAARPGEKWLLITSAWHMPRSMGVFRRAGIDVVAYPVDFTTSGKPRDYTRLNRGFSHGLLVTDLAVKEWIGLIAYRLAGYTDELLPGPR